ncbi:hypothetical protein QE429_002892 [Bacillus sp. SORGH_AS 510]|uniref:hypothetical protein n=1 Tax=Bacillus sp. SORGH_AS_0510 TaxID=3041771 RepID=UPI002789CF42|nr:hypothetical protein [Bacillus sp. SORGH_AS_0510]MDQ1146065.1 hypothetical protein [Bacillus sp. SORGH_AS_0510]
MKINNSYPYPVLYLNNDDYVESSFNTNIKVYESFGEVKIHADFQLNNQGIHELIEKQLGVYLIHIECGQTSFRQAYESSLKTLDISIPTSVLRGKILIHSFILAKEKIDHYQNHLLSDWFKDIPITFEKGNFLAIGDAIETTLFEENLELLNLPSIAKVTKSHKNEFMEVDIHSSIITISLPEYEYNQYASNANSRFKNTILSTVIVPSLVYVFSKIQDNSGDLEEYTWYQILEKIFAENNLSIHDVGTDSLSALKAAQMVLRKPLKTSFEEIEKLNKMED